MKELLVLVLFHAGLINIRGECLDGCSLPITIYNDLKCIPEYDAPDACCPTQYDCSHIYNRTEQTCHFKGRIYKPQERANETDALGSCKHSCHCQTGPTETHFFCHRPLDGCPEHWVSNFLKPTCFLKHELNRCCAKGQACPPFDDLTKCKVNGTIYKEGQLFNHPTQKCKKCVCQKGFDGKLEKPFCDEVQCFEELKHSGPIDDYCAPFYSSRDACCPNKWICPSKGGKFLPPSEDYVSKHNGTCNFGKEIVPLGGRYHINTGEEKVHCECLIPPLMSCRSKPFKV